MQGHNKSCRKSGKIGRAPTSFIGSLGPGYRSMRREFFLPPRHLKVYPLPEPESSMPAPLSLVRRLATLLVQAGRPVALMLATGFLGVGMAGAAEEIQHLSITLPGGMPGLPVM